MARRGSARGAGIPIRTGGGRIVGRVVGNTFQKRVKGSRHFLRTPLAICFDTQTLIDAQKSGAQFCEVTDRESGRTYHASIHEILQRGFTLNRGHGAQVALPLVCWATGADVAGMQLAMAF